MKKKLVRWREKVCIGDYIKLILSPNRHFLCQTKYELSPILLNGMKYMNCSTPSFSAQSQVFIR